MLSLKEEAWKDAVDDLKEMFQVHWDEMVNYESFRPLDPDWDRYATLAEQGIIKLFVLRDGEKPVGYAMFLISPNMHYKTWNYAMNDIYYLAPEYRNEGIGSAMFSDCEKILKDLGIHCIIFHDRVDHSHEKLFKGLGYNVIEQIYEKVI